MNLIITILLITICQLLHSQNDILIILHDTVKPLYSTTSSSKKQFKAIIAADDLTTDLHKYKSMFHQPPVCQGNTGTCWCYAATSFIESEIFRLSHKKVKLSEMYFVYWEYVEKAADFVRTRGNTYIDEGSESSALLRIISRYGAVPSEAYAGKPSYRTYHSHRQLIEQIKNFLAHIKKYNIWNESFVVETVKQLLEKEFGKPPASFEYEGKVYSPQSFISDFLKLNIYSYFQFMSTESVSYYEKHELVENDNWWHDAEYYNVPCDTFIKLIRKAIENGYTICLCGDISEVAYFNNDIKTAQIALFDIPANAINDDSREMRLQNYTTTDDHCVHVVGYTILPNGNYWYLIKDSNGHTFDGNFAGYRFYDESYIRFKMMNIMIHSDAARWLLDKIIK